MAVCALAVLVCHDEPAVARSAAFGDRVHFAVMRFFGKCECGGCQNESQNNCATEDVSRRHGRLSLARRNLVGKTATSVCRNWQVLCHPTAPPVRSGVFDLGQTEKAAVSAAFVYD